MFYVILVVLIGYVIYRFISAYRMNTYDTVVAFTGGLGSGKSFLSVQTAVKLLKRKRREVWWHNVTHKDDKWEKPLLYSSIPVRISRKEMATVLTDKHLLLQAHIVKNSVLLLDEIGGYCSQFDYRAINADVFDEFVRFFRHYVQGYLVCNDQCSENIVLQVRRRLNTVYNLMCFRKRFFFFYTVKVRNISVSEEIKTIEEQDTEDNMTTLFGFLPRFRRYDTHCYAHRYDRVPTAAENVHSGLTTDKILRMSKAKVETIDQKIAKENI
ncbi:MAG: hypothetical protein IJY39_02540 [Clostridia bacterium]|nr:hypothetical protein [Clostridia bacterium]MBQ9785200.1 hypothetical protein [Clostridia bacterium]